jgi:hypothetical protein
MTADESTVLDTSDYWFRNAKAQARMALDSPFRRDWLAYAKHSLFQALRARKEGR